MTKARTIVSVIKRNILGKKSEQKFTEWVRHTKCK